MNRIISLSNGSVAEFFLQNGKAKPIVTTRLGPSLATIRSLISPLGEDYFGISGKGGTSLVLEPSRFASAGSGGKLGAVGAGGAAAGTTGAFGASTITVASLLAGMTGGLTSGCRTGMGFVSARFIGIGFTSLTMGVIRGSSLAAARLTLCCGAGIGAGAVCTGALPHGVQLVQPVVQPTLPQLEPQPLPLQPSPIGTP